MTLFCQEFIDTIFNSFILYQNSAVTNSGELLNGIQAVSNLLFFLCTHSSKSSSSFSNLLDLQKSQKQHVSCPSSPVQSQTHEDILRPTIGLCQDLCVVVLLVILPC